MLAITNAYMPGEDSVGERMRLAYQDQEEFDRLYPGTRIGATMYYDSLEDDTAAGTDPETIMEVSSHIRGASIWLDPETIDGLFLHRANHGCRNRRKY